MCNSKVGTFVSLSDFKTSRLVSTSDPIYSSNTKDEAAYTVNTRTSIWIRSIADRICITPYSAIILIRYSWTPTIIVRSCDLILILFLFNHIASLSRPHLFRISTTFDREFIGHHRVSSSPAHQPIIVNSSSAQLAPPSLPAQLAQSSREPITGLITPLIKQTNSTLSTYSFFSIIYPQFRHRFHC
jgi:hypothetical protein